MQVQVLRCIKPPTPDNVVLGQYTGAGGQDGYLDDATVPAGSRTPTFAQVVLYIDNDRWAGVPFIMKAGKALNERKAEIRIQLRQTPHWLFPGDPSSCRNELVVRLQPDEAIYMKFVVKKPGKAGPALGGTRGLRVPRTRVREDVPLPSRHSHPTWLFSPGFPGSPPPSLSQHAHPRHPRGDLQNDATHKNALRTGLETEPVISELNLDYQSRYPGVVIPDAYPKLILDAIRGDQQQFVRRDELRAAWAIFTPLLHDIDAGKVPVHPYAYGSRGPAQADELRTRAGWVKNEKYDWVATPVSPR